jgi:serine/threonine protein kinase
MVTIQNLTRREDLPYVFVGSLVGGGYATVMEVKRRRDGETFAMKVMYTQRRTRRILEETLREEVKIIKALEENNNFIRVYEAYQTPTEVGLVVWPVADRRTLAACLEEYLDKPSSRDVLQPILVQAFGCLASGLAFMHSRKIRHKDIKPANILVHAGAILRK